MKLIDKDKIVAELEKLIDKGKYHDNYECAFRDGNNNALYALKAKINTLEVKEVDEEPVSEELEKAIEKSFIYHKNHGDDFRSDKQIETAYMYGFETGANWANKHLIGMIVSNKA